MAKSSRVSKKAKAPTGKPAKKTAKKKQVKAPAASAPKKKTAKPPVKKKAAPKKKATAKKATTKKVALKKTAVKAATATARKKAAPSQKTISRLRPAKSSSPTAELSEELVEKAANTSSVGEGEVKLPGDGSGLPVPVEDPVKAFDKHAAEKATSKGDPQHTLQFSQTNKRQIKPSGKKPLWRK